MARVVTVFRAKACGHMLGVANNPMVVAAARPVLDFAGVPYYPEEVMLGDALAAEFLAQTTCPQCRPNPPQETQTP